MVKRPRSPSDPRPNNRPSYISPFCPACRGLLVLADLIADPDAPPEDVWHDEWQCPSCLGQIFLDTPDYP